MSALMLSMAAGKANMVSLMHGDLGFSAIFLAAAAWMFLRALYILATEPLGNPQYGRHYP